MCYRETFIIKHGERLILKGVDPSGKEHHESQPGTKDEIAANWRNYSRYSTRRRNDPFSSFCRLDAGAKTEWSITCYPSSIRKVRELMASSGQR